MYKKMKKNYINVKKPIFCCTSNLFCYHGINTMLHRAGRTKLWLVDRRGITAKNIGSQFGANHRSGVKTERTLGSLQTKDRAEPLSMVQSPINFFFYFLYNLQCA